MAFYSPVRSLLFVLLCVVSSFALSSCGGGGGAEGGTGSVALLVTGAPAGEFSEINVRISRIDLISDAGSVTIFSGDKTIDLLNLTGESELFSISSGVPPGLYSKFRLYVASLWLVRPDGSVIYPKLPKNGRIDLNPRMTFPVEPGATLVLELDLDAGKSIHIVQAGSSGEYIFRPVVFVKVVNGITTGNLVRVRGYVRGIDAANGFLTLCPDNTAFNAAVTGPGEGDGQGRAASIAGCLPVFVATDTSFFDNNGDPSAFSSLADNSLVTAVGRVVFNGAWSAFYRAEGACSVGPCTVGIDAEVVESGSFLVVDGIVRSSPDSLTKIFNFEVNPAQGFTAGTILEALLQSGTKIFSKLGEPMGSADITPGKEATIDGVLSLSSTGPDVLKTSLILLDTVLPADVHLEGVISAVDYAAGAFGLQVSGGASTACVSVPVGSHIFLVTLTEASFCSDSITFGGLVYGQRVELYGGYNQTGCFEPKVILAAPLGT